MSRAFAYLAYLLAALLAVWYVAGWTINVRSIGVVQAVNQLVRWPSIIGTVGIPVLAIVFLALGTTLLTNQRPAPDPPPDR